MKTLLSTFFGLFLILSMTAQVGVNNPTPEQTLDVNGKVKLTNDATEPSAGTMRYEASSNDFEGYDGSQWNSFTQSRSSGLPSNPVPVFGYVEDFSSNGTVSNMTFIRWVDGSLVSEIPDGKFLIVTSIDSELVGTIADENIYNVFIGPSNSTTDSPSFVNGTLNLRGKGHLHNINRDSSQSPIFILRSGQYLNYSNTTSNGIYITVRGFIVDDLNY